MSAERLLIWEVRRFAELEREWRASSIEYERTMVEGIPALRVVVNVPDPKQEGPDARIGFLCTSGATVQLGPNQHRLAASPGARHDVPGESESVLDDIIRCLDIGHGQWVSAHEIAPGEYRYDGIDGPLHELLRSTRRRLHDYRNAE